MASSTKKPRLTQGQTCTKYTGRGKTGVGNIFLKPDLRLKSTPV